MIDLRLTFVVTDPEEFPGRAIAEKWDSCPAVNGLSMHIHAFAVVRDEGGCQVAADPSFTEEVSGLQDVCGAALQTVDLFDDGREWVIAMFPHGV